MVKVYGQLSHFMLSVAMLSGIVGCAGSTETEIVDTEASVSMLDSDATGLTIRLLWDDERVDLDLALVKTEALDCSTPVSLRDEVLSFFGNSHGHQPSVDFNLDGRSDKSDPKIHDSLTGKSPETLEWQDLVPGDYSVIVKAFHLPHQDQAAPLLEATVQVFDEAFLVAEKQVSFLHDDEQLRPIRFDVLTDYVAIVEYPGNQSTDISCLLENDIEDE